MDKRELFGAILLVIWILDFNHATKFEKKSKSMKSF